MNTEKQLTAVEYIKEKLLGNEYWYEDLTFDQIINQAKEMEKEQISKAYFEGWSCPHGEGFPETGEEYYNKTFKSE